MAVSAASAQRIGVGEIERAARTIAGAVRTTPVLNAGEISRRFGATVMLKAENLQRTGSFKVRGANNLLAALAPEELARGVVAASAGNHAQAISLAARERGARAVIYMPEDAPLAKIDAVRRYGGEVRLVDGLVERAFDEAQACAEREGLIFAHAFDDPVVIAGQGTIGLEIAEQAPAAKLVVVAIGGGALSTGIAIAVKDRLPGVRVVGVQSDRCAPYARSEDRLPTICDGIAVKRPGRITRPLVDEWIDEVVTVSDDDVAQAMVLLLERSKLVVEGAGAASVAALLAGRIEPPEEGETVAVLSGGNVDASRLVECIRLGENASGRRLVFSTVVPDRPGALASLVATVAEERANVLDVAHIREGIDLHVRETEIRLVLQTDGPEHGERILEAVRKAGFPARREAAT
jgi:threonine dehydratase